VAVAFFECLSPQSIWLFCLSASAQEMNISDACRLLEEAGNTCDEDGLKAVFQEYRERMKGRWGWFQVRVSTTRLFLLNAKIRQSESRKSAFLGNN